MSDITITLLENKSTRQNIDGYEVNALVNRSGYQVVAGENNDTEIRVIYPTKYNEYIRYVHMQNQIGEYAIYEFVTSEQIKKLENEQRIKTLVQMTKPNTKDLGYNAKFVRAEVNEVSFKLPATMTYAGNTWLTFFATENNNDNTAIKVVWQSVHIPIKATHSDYKKVAQTSPDILENAIKAIEAVRKLLQPPELIENGGVATVEIDSDKGNFVFKNINGRAATVAVGAVNSIPFGGGTSVVNVGDANHAVLNFNLERGDRGYSIRYGNVPLSDSNEYNLSDISDVTNIKNGDLLFAEGFITYILTVTDTVVTISPNRYSVHGKDGIDGKDGNNNQISIVQYSGNPSSGSMPSEPRTGDIVLYNSITGNPADSALDIYFCGSTGNWGKAISIAKSFTFKLEYTTSNVQLNDTCAWIAGVTGPIIGDCNQGDTIFCEWDGSEWINKLTIPSQSNKQDELVSGINIKTINGESILGSGDIALSRGVTTSYVTINIPENTQYNTPFFVNIAKGQVSSEWIDRIVNIKGSMQVGAANYEIFTAEYLLLGSGASGMEGYMVTCKPYPTSTTGVIMSTSVQLTIVQVG